MNKNNAGFLVLLGFAAAIALGAFFLAPSIFKTETEVASVPAPKTNMVDATAPADQPQEAPVQEGLPADAAEAEAGSKPAEATEPAMEGDSFAMPGFDLLRVEPDGSTVIAGKAEPGTTLEIMNGETVIATTEVGSSGDFAVVLDTPLPAGDYQLTLRVTDADGKVRQSEEVATVSVPESADGELLAMVSKPGKASRIITQPKAAPVDDAVEIAAASAPPQNAETAEAAGTGEGADGSQAAATLGSEGAAPAAGEAEARAGTAAAGASESGSEAGTELAAADTSAGNAGAGTQTPALPEASSVLTTSAPQVSGESEGVDEPETAATPDQETEAEDANANAESEVALAAPASDAETAPAPVPADASVRVDAVEIEGDRIFVAGSATAGHQVRVSADGKLIGTDTADETGRFIVEATGELAVGDHFISADMMDKAGETVLLRATVPFNRPEGGALAAVAPAEPAEEVEVADAEPAGEASAPEDLVQHDIAGLSKMRESAFDALSALKQMTSSGQQPDTAEMGAAMEDAVDKLKAASIAELPAGSSAEAQAIAKSMRLQARSALAALAPGADGAVAEDAGSTGTGDEPSPVDRLVTGDLSKMAEALSQAETALAAPADMTDAELAGEEIVAAGPREPGDLGEPGEPKTILQAPLASTPGAVIIRRGDTLWQISRRTYGEGVRYTTIYLANRSQIQNPNRIQPGQVFSVPEEPMENAEEMHKKLLGEAKKR
ncbi:LysM domain-containing protein [Hoeflea halophila]|uniref:LysM domain-containing protein n=1 Tax=Hoeflea halophila TaxID=714899 RepID=A0A286HMY5_9HYPH|nr:Ig-like domain-containing protein [Hoeflea halophila]SOE08846.1 LysM domain-containing protein [Hoeflea halophila]